MNDAVLYAKSNSFQRVATNNIFREFAHLLKWRKGGCDSVLDIGCGTGDVTIELVLPLLPSNFNRLIGIDISDKMIEYARQYNDHPKVLYNEVDIAGSVDEFLAEFGSFDHVVSFFCLHWVRNQYDTMKNISKLLTPNGDCFLLFITSSNIYTVYEEMLKSSKWSQYMEDVEQFTSPYYYSLCPTDDLRTMLQDVGFTECTFQTRVLKHLYENYEEFANFVRSINPFVNRIHASEQGDYLIDVARRIMAKNIQQSGIQYLNLTDVVIVYAKK